MTLSIAPPLDGDVTWDDLASVNQTDPRDAARIYARMGLTPIAVHGIRIDGTCTCARAECEAVGKHPIERDWQRAAVDADRLDSLLVRVPCANVGLRMGKQHARLTLLCIDIDGDRELLEPLENELGALPDTLTAGTGVGQHLLYRIPDGALPPRNRVRLSEGVDLRSTGGQIVAPPSKHRTGRRYRWLDVRAPEVLPSAWIARLGFDPTTASKQTAGRARNVTPYALAALTQECAAVRGTAVGGRNNRLNAAALKIGQLVAGGSLDEELAVNALCAAAASAGLGQRETDATIRSGLEAGRRQPRSAPQQTSPAATPTSSGRIDILGAHGIFAPLEPPEYLIEPVIIRGSVAELVAYGASGKTWVAVDAALSVGAGVPWLGRFRAAAGEALYLDWENGTYELRRRMQAVARARALVTPVAGVALAAMPDLYMSAPDFAERLKPLADGRALIIVDTLRAATPGFDENDSRIRSGIDLLHRVGEQTGCAFLVLAHAKKTSRDESVTLREAGRGSSAIFDAADTVFHLTYTEGEPLRVSHTKARTGNAVSPFAVRIYDGDDGAVHVDASDAPQTADRFDDLCDRVLAIVRENPGESTRVIRERVGGRSTAVAAALDRLRHAGAVRNTGAGRADCWVAIVRNGGQGP